MLLVLDPEGKKLDQVEGYVTAEALRGQLSRALAKAPSADDPAARVMERVERELRDARARLVEDVRRMVREELARPARPPALGVSPDAFTDEERKALGVTGGIRIGEVRGAAQKAGLKPGDVLLSIAGAPVSEETILATLGRFKAGDEVEVVVLRDRARRTFRVVLSERKD